MGNERLLARRRRTRRRVLFGTFLLLVALSAAFLWGVRQSAVRISEIHVYGTDRPLPELALKEMEGSYWGIVPRDSTFFLPVESIRHNILTAYPDLAAVSIFRIGTTGLSLKADYRVPIARWCGLAIPEEGVDEYCYVFDASGVIFASLATTTRTINPFALYARLEGEALEPLRAIVAQPEALPGTFDFARQLATLGSPVSSIVLRGGEVDCYLASGTRITYVLGDEQKAFTSLVSARENLNLADGSLDYVDLRFDGKVYTKKK